MGIMIPSFAEHCAICKAVEELSVITSDGKGLLDHLLTAHVSITENNSDLLL